LLGLVGLPDQIRPEAHEAVETLRASDKRVAMLTGDSRTVAEWVAARLGITEVYAEVLPDQKVAAVTRLQADGSRVAMVGDGVNDAPALVQADVGLAIGSGTDVAISSADVLLAAGDPRGVPAMIRLSAASYRIMRQNLAWAVGYNAIAIPLAAGAAAGLGVVVGPAVAAALMSISTIIVALNAQTLRFRRTFPRSAPGQEPRTDE
jgi:Cu2+-exporting ATPase